MTTPEGAPSFMPPPLAPLPPNHPKALPALVLGVIGLSVGVTAPVAWILGAQALRDIDANPGAYSGRDLASVGKVLGIVGTAIIAAGLVLFVAIFGWVFLELLSAFS